MKNSIYSIIALNFFAAAAIATTIPILPFHAQKLGLSVSSTGILIGLFFAFQAISGLAVGRLTSKLGTKRSLIVTCGLLLIANALFLIAEEPVMLFASRAIMGLSAAFATICIAYVSQFPNAHREKATRRLISSSMLGYLIGPGLIFFLGKGNFLWVLGLANFFSVVTLILSFSLPASTSRNQKKASLSQDDIDLYFNRLDAGIEAKQLIREPDLWGLRFARDWRLTPLLIQTFCFFLGFAAFYQGIALYAQATMSDANFQFDQESAGLLYVILGVVAIFSNQLQTRLIPERFSGEIALILGSWISLSGVVFLALFKEPWVLFVASVPIMFGYSIFRYHVNLASAGFVPPGSKAHALGLINTTMALTWIIGPPIAARLVDLQLTALWAPAIASALLVGSLYAVHYRRKNAK